MIIPRLLAHLCLVSFFSSLVVALPSGERLGRLIKSNKRELLQNIVTWDDHSLFVHGERVMIYSGEFHPFRLPVPGLWLDVFQKIRALGYNTVSFYVDWSLVEGEPGSFRADGIFAFEPFFEAASQAGLYLIARPGPYINAETSGGGFPGWLQRVPGHLRTNDASYLAATENYVRSIGEIVAKAQITNGGPVILLQPENEYTQAQAEVVFPNAEYFAYVEQQYRNAGIVVPLVNNDAGAKGYFVPGSGLGEVDIYGFDNYPMRYDCVHPYDWPNQTEGSYFNTQYYNTHLRQSPSTPNAIMEFQGGVPSSWAGVDPQGCAILMGPETERVLYKNNYAQGVTLFNIYMTYGGTNWGNLGHPGGDTSYDYGAVITEDRQVWREKYSEQKIQAHFLAASPAYLTAVPHNGSNGTYTSASDLTTTPLFGETTNFFVVRHALYYSLNTTTYTLTLPTSHGNLTIPQTGGHLTLFGRDSKIHVTDYELGDHTLLYSTAEIFTWQSSPQGTVLVLYGGVGEYHEVAIKGIQRAVPVEGTGVNITSINNATVLSWTTTTSRRIVKISEDLHVYILDRSSVYNYWVLPLHDSSNKSTNLIAKAGYLLRNGTLQDGTLSLHGDLNATTTLEIISGVDPRNLHTLLFNDKPIPFSSTHSHKKVNSNSNSIIASLIYTAPKISLPDLSLLPWKYTNSLPELSATYNDTLWPKASQPFTRNTVRNLTTPTSLYSGDYGFHAGSFIYRGSFNATGTEKWISVLTQGGTAYATSAWLDDEFLGSWVGDGIAENYTSVYTLSPSSSSAENDTVRAGEEKGPRERVLTVVVDMMGYTMNYRAGDATLMKTPRGILDYTLDGHSQSDIQWKITGNLGGEAYVDKTRGPLNEGAFFAERQGWHLPDPPTGDWELRSPVQGIEEAGVGFFVAEFGLDLPCGYDVPLSFVFGNGTAKEEEVEEDGKGGNFRVQLFVNGYQFGKYVNNLGPQTKYPVPEGILNHRGKNWVALTLWALDSGGAKLESFELQAQAVIQSGYGDVPASPQPKWEKREGAY